MSASFNQVILLGNLGQDPETKTIAGGKTVTTFRLATNQQWTDSAGARQERVDWHDIEVWGKQAQNCAKYLTKGRSTQVVGSLRTDTWEKDGAKHSRVKVVAARVIFLGSRDKPEAEAEVAGDETGSADGAAA
jgi:single-strand DNA-binding protein